MNIEKNELLKNILISRYEHSGKFYSKAELNIDGYVVKIESKDFDTLDEAVTSIKDRIVQAIKNFKPEIKQPTF